MIFVDTSAFFAILDRGDNNHAAARLCWFRLVGAGAPMLTTNYVLVESCTLVQSRLGMDAVSTLLDDLLPLVSVECIDAPTHADSVTALLSARRRKLSLVDCSSFVVMRKHRCSAAFAFDRHFVEQGFQFPK